jgi:hypothetical protein
MLPWGLRLFSYAHPRAPVVFGAARPFSAFNADRHEGRDKNLPWMNKQKTAEFIRAQGLRTAKTFHILDSAQEITAASIPDRCVIKPVEGTNSGGVMVLRRDGNAFYDLMQRKTVTLEQIRHVQLQSQKQFSAQFSICSSKVIIEEAILDEDGPDLVPFDYKVWTFNGRVAFIEQIDRNTVAKRVAWYLNDFRPIEIEDVAFPELKRLQRGSHRLPRCRDDIIRIAAAASRALYTPYVRVDTYATPEGAAIGELTLASGGLHYGAWRFQPWFDNLLGRRWAKAARELQKARLHAPAPLPKK